MDREAKKKTIGRRLLADHARLDGLFERLMNCVHVDDRSATEAVWTEFENALLAHLEAEEVHLLPIFANVNRAEVTAILEDHARIRYLLAEMGVRLELHCVKEQTVERFIESLRAHAQREERLFYPWADKEVSSALGDSIRLGAPSGARSEKASAT